MLLFLPMFLPLFLAKKSNIYNLLQIFYNYILVEMNSELFLYFELQLTAKVMFILSILSSTDFD